MIHHSSQRLDGSSVAHVRIKAIKQLQPPENEDSQQIKEFQETISRLQKDNIIDSSQNLIQQVLVLRRMEDVRLDKERNVKEQFTELYDLS